MTAQRRTDPEAYAKMLSRIPIGRYGEPIEIANGVLYLASDESRWVTGSELVLDGGWTATMMEYKGYHAAIKYDADSEVFHGAVT